MAEMTERCKLCVYYCNSDGHYIYPSCDYILLAGHSRGCPAGDECSRFIPSEDCLRFTNTMLGTVKLPVKEQKLIDLYDQGLTDKEIGKAVGLSRSAISLWRRKKGLPSQQELQKGAEQ